MTTRDISKYAGPGLYGGRRCVQCGARVAPATYHGFRQPTPILLCTAQGYAHAGHVSGTAA